MAQERATRSGRFLALAGFLACGLGLVGLVWWLRSEAAQGGAVTTGQRPSASPSSIEFPSSDSSAATPTRLAVPNDLAEVPPEGESAAIAYPPGIETYTITGRVVDAQGLAWAGARVRLVPDPTTGDALAWKVDSYELDLKTLRVVTTGEDGRFSLTAPWLPGPGLYRGRGMQASPVALVAADRMAWHAFAVQYHDGHDRDIGDLVVSMPAAAIVAHVVDERGAPIEGAEAGIYSWGLDKDAESVPGKADAEVFNVMGLARGSSDAEGHLQLTDLWPSEGTISFSDPSHVSKQLKDVKVRRGETVDLGDVVMSQGGTVAGVVRDESGSAIPGATVWARAANDLHVFGLDDADTTLDALPLILDQIESSRTWRTTRAPVIADARGRFDRPGLEGAAVDVVVVAPGYEPVRVSGVPIGTMNVDVALKHEANLQVGVVDGATGDAVEGTSLKAFRWAGTDNGMFKEMESERVVTPGSHAGEFVVHTIGPRGTRLVAEAPGRATQEVFQKAAEPVVIRMQPEATVEGRVVSDSGEPIDGVTVRLRPLTKDGQDDVWRDHPDAVARKECKTVADGRFRFDRVSEGKFKLHTSCVGYRAPEPMPLEIALGDRVELPPLVLSRATEVRGIVRDADGKPAGGLQVYVGWSPPGGSGRNACLAETDHTGAFALLDVPAGNHVVKVGEDLGSEPLAEEPIEVAEGASLVVDFMLPRFAVVHGVVTSAGRGVSGAEVHAECEESKPNRRQAKWSTKSDTDGGYVVTIKHPGPYRIWAEKPGGGRSSPISAQVSWGLDYPRDFDLGGASIAGHLVDAADGTVPVGARMRLLRDGQPASAWIEIGDAGSFVIDPLPAGRYVVQTEGGPYPLATSPTELQLDEGQKLEGVVITVAKGAVIDAIVLDVHGQPDAAWVFLVTPGDPTKAESHGAPKGKARIEGLLPGHYRLVVAGPSYEYFVSEPALGRDPRSLEEASAEVTLEAGEHREVTLQKVR
jgi:hypothetical protein